MDTVGVGGDAIMGGQQVDMALEMELLWPIHSLPTPLGERRGRREEGDIGERRKQGDGRVTKEGGVAT